MSSISAKGADAAGFNSKLSAPRDRFLSAVVEHALGIGRRSPRDFLRFFPPRAVMNALAEQPQLRAKLLVNTIGLNEKVALRKSASSAGEDLEIALLEHVTEEADVVRLFDPDDRVRYLEHAKLWEFVIEGEFWRPNEATSVAVPREHVAFILSRARAEKLIADAAIIDGVGLDVLVASLPKADIVRVLDRAIGEGRAGRVLKEDRILDVLSPQLLVEHVPLAHLWERLIAEKLAFVRETATTDATANGSPTMPPPSATSLSVTSEMPAAGSVSDLVAAATNSEAPSVTLSVDEDDPLIIDESREQELNIEVDAMLSKVSDRPPQAADAGASSHRAGRPSNPPPPLPREASRAVRD